MKLIKITIRLCTPAEGTKKEKNRIQSSMQNCAVTRNKKVQNREQITIQVKVRANNYRSTNLFNNVSGGSHLIQKK